MTKNVSVGFVGWVGSAVGCGVGLDDSSPSWHWSQPAHCAPHLHFSDHGATWLGHHALQGYIKEGAGDAEKHSEQPAQFFFHLHFSDHFFT